MRSFTVLIVSLMNTSILAWWWSVPPVDAVPAIVVVAVLSSAAWFEVGRLARQMNTPTDVDWMSQGVCPVCQRGGALVEVTSHAEGSLVGCRNCGQQFDIRKSEKGPVVMRTGKPTNE